MARKLNRVRGNLFAAGFTLNGNGQTQTFAIPSSGSENPVNFRKKTIYLEGTLTTQFAGGVVLLCIEGSNTGTFVDDDDHAIPIDVYIQKGNENQGVLLDQLQATLVATADTASAKFNAVIVIHEDVAIKPFLRLKIYTSSAGITAGSFTADRADYVFVDSD